MDAPPVDALVIGAGPAGLTAALYLTRFKRRVRVVHDGRSRALWVPRTRNVPGFPDGIVGKELIERMPDHAPRPGPEIVPGRVPPPARPRAHFRAAPPDGAPVPPGPAPRPPRVSQPVSPPPPPPPAPQHPPPHP